MVVVGVGGGNGKGEGGRQLIFTSLLHTHSLGRFLSQLFLYPRRLQVAFSLRCGGGVSAAAGVGSVDYRQVFFWGLFLGGGSEGCLGIRYRKSCQNLGYVGRSLIFVCWWGCQLRLCTVYCMVYCLLIQLSEP